jgi:flagellar hook protein FlgE
MLRSLYSAISGMQAFNTKLDVIGNNIANVNTTGFKAGRVDFSDTLSQTMAGASAPTATMGGTNPQQVGLGVHVGAIQTLFTQGANQSTGVPTDVMLQGAGLFVVSPDGGNHTYLTREGDFVGDAANNLVLPNGAVAQGFVYKPGVNAAGNPISQLDPALKPVPMNFGTMLDSYVSSLPGTTDAAGTTYDAWAAGTNPLINANTHVDSITYTTGGTQYNRQFQIPSQPDVQIGADGTVSVTVNVTDTPVAGGAPVVSTQSIALGKLAVATVNNPGGLDKQGNSMYTTTANSGPATYQVAGTNNAGTIASGYVEMSNVDLTREFTEMIVAQRGFDANSKMIGTDNAILQDIVNLKNG